MNPAVVFLAVGVALEVLSVILLARGLSMRPRRGQSVRVHLLQALSVVCALVFLAAGADIVLYRGPAHTVVIRVSSHHHGRTNEIVTSGGDRYDAPRGLYRQLVDGRRYACSVRDQGHLALEPPLLVSCHAAKPS